MIGRYRPAARLLTITKGHAHHPRPALDQQNSDRSRSPYFPPVPYPNDAFTFAANDDSPVRLADDTPQSAAEDNHRGDKDIDTLQPTFNHRQRSGFRVGLDRFWWCYFSVFGYFAAVVSALALWPAAKLIGEVILVLVYRILARVLLAN